MGKLKADVLRNVLRPITKSTQVIVPPIPGFDSGVHEICGDKCLVIATDPCLGVPRKWFGWLLIHYAASDVAIFGAKPRYCDINLLAPKGTPHKLFKEVMRQAATAAETLGMDIITGHTGTYDGISTLIGTSTAYGFVEKDKLITPAGAKPGNYLMCTKPFGHELLVNFALTQKTLANRLFGRNMVLEMSQMFRWQTCVDEALLLADAGGVTAMHDATEGGFTAAINEIADASNVGFMVDHDSLPILPEIGQLAEHFQLNWKQVLSSSSTGTLLISVPPNQKVKVINSLSKFGLQPKTIGIFSSNIDRTIKIRGKTVSFPSLADDPYSKIMRE